MKNKREMCLEQAKACVLKDRNSTYGEPENSFGHIAELWSVYSGYPHTATDVAVMLALLKIARIRSNPYHFDNFVDLAGYAVCAAECVKDGENE